MIPAQLAPRPDGRTTFRAYCGDRLLIEVVSPNGDNDDQVVDELWAAVQATVTAGHQVLLAVFDTKTGLPLPVARDRQMAAG
jgi:hypothetical protein